MSGDDAHAPGHIPQRSLKRLRIVGSIDQQKLNVCTQRRFDDRRVRSISVDGIGEQSANGWEPLGILEDRAHGVGQPLPGLDHLLKQVTSRIEPRPLVSSVGQLSAQRRLAVAQLRHRPLVLGQLRFEPLHLALRLGPARFGLMVMILSLGQLLITVVSSTSQTIGLLGERLASPVHGLDVRGGLCSLLLGAGRGFPQPLMFLLGRDKLFLESTPFITDLRHRLLSLGELACCPVDSPLRVLELLRQRLNPRRKISHPSPILVDLLTGFGEVPLDEHPPLLGVLVRRDETDLLLLQLVLLRLKVVSSELC